jgi:hypothetical protein
MAISTSSRRPLAKSKGLSFPRAAFDWTSDFARCADNKRTAAKEGDDFQAARWFRSAARFYFAESGR